MIRAIGRVGRRYLFLENTNIEIANLKLLRACSGSGYALDELDTDLKRSGTTFRYKGTSAEAAHVFDGRELHALSQSHEKWMKCSKIR